MSVSDPFASKREPLLVDIPNVGTRTQDQT